MGASARLRARTLRARFQRMRRELADQDDTLADLRRAAGLDPEAVERARRELAAGGGDPRLASVLDGVLDAVPSRGEARPATDLTALRG